ncbi:YbaN family protein [Ottowia sp.]|uniref:YbaN family protein n=1 Tax=Ottowia sp. TaxID=1898956 RepID=UPI0039E72759
MNQPRKPDLPSEARVVRRRRIALLLWRAVTVVFVGLAAVGTVLPVMPTVPFLLVAAWAASRGWPEFERWLLRHPRFGPPIRHWRERGAVPRRAKWISSLMMAGSGIGMQFFSQIPLGLRIAVPAVMLAVAVWLWTRPDA